MDAGAQLHGGRKAERPTMWLMSDIEAAVAIVALMLALAVMVAG
jgi:hypothetical protein